MIGDRRYPMILARNFTPLPAGEAPRKIDLVVIHDMEASESTDTAERCARYFAGQPRQGSILGADYGPQRAGEIFKFGSSAHFCIDATHVYQSVFEKDVAWHAPGANHNGIGLELAGYASQTERDWTDAYSSKVILNAANLTGDLCLTYQIPVEFVDERALYVGKRGITTHACVSRAFGKSSHFDPGKNFPLGLFIELVKAGVIPLETDE